MKTYIGGQIREEHRGNLAAVITREPDTRIDSFLYPVDSEEFIHLTGVRSVSRPVERVYAGVSHAAGEMILRRAQAFSLLPSELETQLDRIDSSLVYDHFLKKNQKPIPTPQ